MGNNLKNKNAVKDKVAILKCTSYNKEELSQKIKKCVSLIGGFEKYISGAKKILLKPNLLSPSAPATAVITHPVFVECIIDIIKKLLFTNLANNNPININKIYTIIMPANETSPDTDGRLFLTG